jgi:putative ABC transport system permease protein
LVAISLATGLIAGLYPAFCLSVFKPINVLKGSGSQRTVTGKSNFRKVAVVFQFFISISLIIGTLTVYRQMQFFLDMDLGFDKQNVLIIKATGRQVQQNYEAYRNTLLGDPRIKNVSASSNFPGEGDYFASLFRRDGSDDSYDLIFMYNDYDFIDLYSLEVLHGRSFSRSFSTDIMKDVVLNELAARGIGYSPEEAVGKRLFLLRGSNQSQEFNIVGVLKDYYFKSLHREIQPLALILNPSRIQYISIKIAPEDVKGPVNFIRGTWERIFPGKLFEFHFLDDYLNRHYDSEARMKNLFLIFAVLSVFVASLGLLGLAAFSAEERTREIGIRKILGASSGNLFLLLNMEFAKWVLVANVIAWPLAYWGMNRWLQSFPYRINQGIWSFVLSAGLALIAALITVSFQSVKAASTNPTDTLKHE